MTGLPRMLRPCGGDEPCPWRRDAPPGQFPAARWEALRATSRRPDEHGMTDAPLGSPMFACHATREGAERACAGWLAVAGWGHVGVRLAVVTGALPQCALTPGPGWPPLYSSYAELAEINGVPRMLTRPTEHDTIGGMTETTTRTAPERHRTSHYLLVETLLRQKTGHPHLTLEEWVIAQRNLGVAWRPMAPKLADAAGLTGRTAVGYEALRKWFRYLDENGDGDETADAAVAARTD